MYYSAIGLLAILTLLIENHDILLRSGDSPEMPAGSVYRRFLFAVLAYYTTDALWGVLETWKRSSLLFADTTVYYIAMGAGVLFWVQYTVAYLEEDDAAGRALIVVGRLIALVITALAVVNVFVPVLFTVDSQSVYRALPMRHVMLSCQIVLLLLISCYALRSLRRGAKKWNRYRTLVLFGLIMALLLFVQLWYPFLPLYTIAYQLGTCLIHTYVVNDEMEEYRRREEETAEMRELKDTISALLENMPGLTFTKDAQTGVYLACNQNFARYTRKQSAEEVVGRTDEELFDPETVAHIHKDDLMALSMDTPFIFFEELPDAEGNLRQLQTTKLKYTDAAGRLCVMGICQDVTDMVRIQRENVTTKEAYERARITGILYAHIAQSLARSFSDLYYINVDTEEYIEYHTDEETNTLVESRRGEHFFASCVADAAQQVYPEDREDVLRALDRSALLNALERSKTFLLTYRLLSDHGPRYVTMKVSRMDSDPRFLIMGVMDVDEQMQQQRLAERMREEKLAYSRINALTGDFLCVYVVFPETGRYREFSASADYDRFALAKEGEDFFGVTRKEVLRFCEPEDLNRFLTAFTREKVMAEIARSGIFTLGYRLLLDGRSTYVQLKAAMVEEKEGQRLIVGINNIDAQTRQEEEYERRLAQARYAVNIDALTGVKNKHAYLDAEKRLNERIHAGEKPEFAVVVLDVNDLKQVNDTEGHKAGDRLLRRACKLVCTTFAHSPVFRIGGDEFAVLSQGEDYQRMDALVEQIQEHNLASIRDGGVIIACGMARYAGEELVAPVFERADERMYENKSMLKAKKREERG